MSQDSQILSDLSLKPLKLGSLELKNGVIMAAMTRCKADPTDSIPNDLMVEYYSQRAEFGAIISECSQISSISNAFPGSGGIYSNEQVEGWKKVTKAVHEKGGKIILQIYHSGRATLAQYINGASPLAPSAIAIRTPHSYTQGPFPVPKEMTKNDINDVIEQFRQSAIKAKEAGFDGLELLGANGYIVDQFLKDGTNKRTDEYGGSIENRSRFALEVLDALISVYGADKVGIKLSPTGRYNDMFDSNPVEMLKVLLQEIEKKNIAFVEVKRHGANESGKAGETVDVFGQPLPQFQMPNFFEQLRPLYNGNLILNDNIDKAEGTRLLQEKQGQAISYATLAIANPDLPKRLLNDWKLAQPDYSKLYAPGSNGYNDYPSFKAN